jgi:hypothetical protein
MLFLGLYFWKYLLLFGFCVQSMWKWPICLSFLMWFFCLFFIFVIQFLCYVCVYLVLILS